MPGHVPENVSEDEFTQRGLRRGARGLGHRVISHQPRTTLPLPGRLDDEECLDRLRLLRSENVGPITFHGLIERFGSASDALCALPALARRGGKNTLRICGKSEALAELEALTTAGARLIAHGEPEYPQALAVLPDAPPLISAKGHMEFLDRPIIAMVGARNSSGAGNRFTRDLAADLGAAGYVVVSGLARGVDTAAHVGALDIGTIAVLAGGIDVVYPPENEDLQDQIAGRGLIPAEQPIGTRPHARHFPTRNRLISGLALGVVVVEAATRSGSLITARCALDQGREVFAVPGSPLDPRCHGSNNLIRDGAVLVQCADDVVSALTTMTMVRATAIPSSKPVAETVIPGDENLDVPRERVIDTLGPTPLSVDELVRQCHLTAPEVLTILLELETAGRLQRHPGNKVSFL